MTVDTFVRALDIHTLPYFCACRVAGDITMVDGFEPHRSCDLIRVLKMMCESRIYLKI